MVWRVDLGCDAGEDEEREEGDERKTGHCARALARYTSPDIRMRQQYNMFFISARGRRIYVRVSGRADESKPAPGFGVRQGCSKRDFLRGTPSWLHGKVGALFARCGLSLITQPHPVSVFPPEASRVVG